MYFNQKKYIIPNDNKSFNFEHDDNIECIQIAEGSVLKCINFCSNPNIKRIEFLLFLKLNFIINLLLTSIFSCKIMLH